MKLTPRLLAPLALLAFPLLAAGQGVGSKLPPIELEGFAQTSARSFDDYQGRAVLLEFFAFW